MWLNTYSLDDILDIWEKDEKDLHDYKEKWYSSWREWRIDKMNKHWVKIDKWYKKSITVQDVLKFRVWTFPSISNFFVSYLNWNPNNYLKIEQTKIEYFEEIYSRNKEKINAIMQNPPREINFIGWERNWEYILTEWHHRAIALARLFKQWCDISNIKINLYYHPVISENPIKNIDYI